MNSTSSRFEALDFARGLAVLVMLGSHLVGTEGGATALERGFTGLVAAMEPTAGALFCVLAGISWSIQAERVGVTPRFRRYFAGRALALGVFGVILHVLFWTTEILVPFAMMMVLSLVVLGAGSRRTALALMLLVATAPVVVRLVAPFAARDWLENGLHVADGAVGWVTLRYLVVDGNYPLTGWMAFPLMGMLFWQTARSRPQLRLWLLGSSGAAVVAFAVAVYRAPVSGWDDVRRWIASGWTPTSAIFLLTAGGSAVAVISALLWSKGTAALPGLVRPLVLFGRASLSHYVLHIVVGYSILRYFYPNEDWLPGVGLVAFMVYLAIGIPLTVGWFRRHTHGPLEMLLASSSRRPAPRPVTIAAKTSAVEVRRESGFASLYAVQSFATGDVVFPLEGDLVRQATRFTIQIGTNEHLDPVSDFVSPWGSLNHGCDPNVAIDIPRRVIVARRPIAAGEQLRFDYNTTEWELAEPFDCHCGAPWCVGVARGFAHLSLARQRILFGDGAPHIRALYAAAAARRVTRVAAPRPDPIVPLAQPEPSRTGFP
jgi:uncharacterized membrane protein YeiB